MIFIQALGNNFFNSSLVLNYVVGKNLAGNCISRSIGIWSIQKGSYWNQNGHDIIRRGPLSCQYIQTNSAIVVNIWMEHFASENNLRTLVRIFFCECKWKLKYSSFPYCLFRPSNQCSHFHQVVLLIVYHKPRIIFFGDSL